MALPLSFGRVLAACQRLAPPWPDVSSLLTKAGAELGSVARVIARCTDSVDAIVADIFPDTAVAQLDRWEAITGIPTRPMDTAAVRQARVLGVLRRAGSTLAQLRIALAPSLGQAPSAVNVVETARSQIEPSMTITSPVGWSQRLPTSSAAPLVVAVHSRMPGTIDETGARLSVTLTGGGGPISLTLVAPDGTTLPVDNAVPPNTTQTYSLQTYFLGCPAGGQWQIQLYDPAGTAVLTGWSLMLSNSIDDAHVYNLLVFRDPALPGTADLVEAQRLLSRAALAHLNPIVAERTVALCDDPHSLVDRDPVGA